MIEKKLIQSIFEQYDVLNVFFIQWKSDIGSGVTMRINVSVDMNFLSCNQVLVSEVFLSKTEDFFIPAEIVPELGGVITHS